MGNWRMESVGAHDLNFYLAVRVTPPQYMTVLNVYLHSPGTLIIHGKDYKALAQCAPFILWHHLNAWSQKIVALTFKSMIIIASYFFVIKVLSLSLYVFQITYCIPFDLQQSCVDSVCKEFLTLAKEHMPSLLQKPKMSSYNMTDFGPASCFNTLTNN